MATVYITKDQHSLYMTNLLGSGEKIEYDWSISSKSYSVIISKGSVSIAGPPIKNKDSVALYRVPPGESLSVTDTASTGTNSSIFVVPFLLSDTAMMNELFPNTSTLTQLLAVPADKNLTTFSQHTDVRVKITSPLSSTTETTGDLVFTLNSLETKVLEGLSL